MRLVNVVAPLMNKPVPAFNWILDTDKTMSKVVFMQIFNQFLDTDEAILPFYQIVKSLRYQLKTNQGPNNAAAPFVLLNIEAIGTFQVFYLCTFVFVSLSLRLCIAQDRSHWHFSGPLSLEVSYRRLKT